MIPMRHSCASTQCHDHPFDHWKQKEFEGLAASFGQLDLYPVGIIDNPDKKYEVVDETAACESAGLGRRCGAVASGGSARSPAKWCAANVRERVRCDSDRARCALCPSTGKLASL